MIANSDGAMRRAYAVNCLGQTLEQRPSLDVCYALAGDSSALTRGAASCAVGGPLSDFRYRLPKCWTATILKTGRIRRVAATLEMVRSAHQTFCDFRVAAASVFAILSEDLASRMPWLFDILQCST